MSPSFCVSWIVMNHFYFIWTHRPKVKSVFLGCKYAVEQFRRQNLDSVGNKHAVLDHNLPSYNRFSLALSRCVRLMSPSFCVSWIVMNHFYFIWVFLGCKYAVEQFRRQNLDSVGNKHAVLDHNLPIGVFAPQKHGLDIVIHGLGIGALVGFMHQPRATVF
jgi:hypothetical protein